MRFTFLPLVTFVAALGVILPATALSESLAPQDLMTESVEYLKRDYPDVDWSKAPPIQCYTSDYQKHLTRANGVIGYYRSGSNALNVNCSGMVTRKQKLLAITHELIHWYQYQVVGRGNYGCVGAIEAEAYSFNIRHFGLASFGPGAFRFNAHRNLKNMAACKPIGGKQKSPWY
jgi:hypothetical protein